jgi:hypothetical protein
MEDQEQMALEFDPSADLVGVTDGLETVTLRRRGSSVATVITHALRRAVTTREATVLNRYNTRKREVPTGGRYTNSDAAWHLPTQQLGDRPRLGDLIVDGQGQRWTILDVQLATLRTRWRCTARDLAVAFALDDTVTILEATYAKGEGGAAEPTWRTWKTGVRARIQPATADVGAKHQARQTTTRYEIFLEEDLALDHNHRIQGPDGTIYKVRATLGAGRIGELQSIDAEVTS